ncbi:energy transducer TonB [Chitinophaga sp. Cy-1792]|uniref:energy transducer TonB n=1 Tax=Chitinophaga sp. Cy-1792 TaxID=2608339 RepID=UPI00141E0AA4|nr:energy transducer TonB [Chitinophaga sp. Cy-1792]NIG52222.1 hypothetical protein [Chitinophaga sp. Cy-1792]
MTDKKPNKEQQVSPELIRQYLAGELDDKAMHALERQALDDPFLADALEGFEAVAPDQQHNIDDLHARLNQRVQPARGKVRALYYRFAAAAAILLVMVVGGYYLVNTTVKPPEVAMKHEPDTTVIPSGDINATKQQPATHEDSMPAGNAKPALMLAQRTLPAKKEKKPVVISQEENAPVVNTWSGNMNADTKISATDSMLEKSHKELNDVVVMGYGVKRKSLESSVPSIQAQPLAIDKSASQQKDSMQVTPMLAGRAPGIMANKNRVDTINVVLQPDNRALSEVVVMGYSKEGEESETPAPEGPRPYGGYSGFKKYIAENNRVSDTALIGATVRIAFKVDKDGDLSDFRVIKGKNIAAGEAAIKIIKNGPSWKGADDGKTRTVKVSITFRPIKIIDRK